MYFYFNFYSIIFIDIPLNNVIVLLVTISMTYFISRHLIKIKLTFWLIFLQTLLDTKSKMFSFFSHGYVVRIVAILFSVYISIKILTFFILSKIHFVNYVVVSLFLVIYYFMILRYKIVLLKNNSSIRQDINSVIKQYAHPFFYSCIIGFVVSIISLFGSVEYDLITTFSSAFEKASDVIRNEDVSYPLRVYVKFSYAFELIIQQLATNIPVIGNIFYCVLVIVTESVTTYFGMALLLISLRGGNESWIKLFHWYVLYCFYVL